MSCSLRIARCVFPLVDFVWPGSHRVALGAPIAATIAGSFQLPLAVHTRRPTSGSSLETTCPTAIVLKRRKSVKDPYPDDLVQAAQHAHAIRQSGRVGRIRPRLRTAGAGEALQGHPARPGQGPGDGGVSAGSLQAEHRRMRDRDLGAVCR